MSKIFIFLAGLLGCLVFAVSGVHAQMDHMSDMPAAQMNNKTTAQAVIMGTGPGSALTGRVDFTETEGGVQVTAHLLNVPAGQHGFHVHENGSCAETGQAAGGHFNPDSHQHGLLAKDGLEGVHAGDLGNITIATDGSGDYSASLKGLSLSEGKYNIVGKAVILHEKADDFGQPTGNAGGRIGCGIIEIIK